MKKYVIYKVPFTKKKAIYHTLFSRKINACKFSKISFLKTNNSGKTSFAHLKVNLVSLVIYYFTGMLRIYIIYKVP